jgi:ubiquinone/menaquinone biosynthesis C-methylase UbiE
MSIKKGDHILEIGFGPGHLLFDMARQIGSGRIEGIDFSKTMVSMAKRKNRKHIAHGKMKLRQGNVDEMPFIENSFDKICTVNTLYFWKEPESTAQKLFNILKPNGKLVIGYEEIVPSDHHLISKDVFTIYSNEDVCELLINAGFSHGVSIESKKETLPAIHCAVGIK